MDYRFVKQQYNMAIDNFFNIFYKFWDMLNVLYDAFWLLIEIFYNFFSIFFNIYLYFYFLILLFFEKISLSQSPIFFWKRFYIRSGSNPRKAYRENIFNPIPARYGGSSMNRTPTVTAKPAASTAKVAAASVAARTASPRRNIFQIIFAPFIMLINGIIFIFKKIGKFFSYRLRPVQSSPLRGRKNLLNQYMKEYEQRKNH